MDRRWFLLLDVMVVLVTRIIISVDEGIMSGRTKVKTTTRMTKTIVGYVTNTDPLVDFVPKLLTSILGIKIIPHNNNYMMYVRRENFTHAWSNSHQALSISFGHT